MKKLFLVTLMHIDSVGLFAQVSTDPSDNFYTQVERWETLGLIERQPALRPYALPVIEKILNAVIESDSESEAEVAKQIYEDTFGKPWGLLLDVTGYAKKKSDGLNKRILAKYGVEGDASFLNFMSAGYQLDFLTDVFSVNNLTPEYAVLPAYRYFSYFMADGKGDTLQNTMEVDGNLAFHFNDFYFQTGINHNSFGPFYDKSIVFSSNSKHTANFVLTYMGKNWNFSEAMFMLSATNSNGVWYNNPSKYPNKWLLMHNIDWNINPHISISFYETVIYGKRFDPSYLIPMLYMVTQGITGYGDDNLFMGGSFVYKPFAGFSVIGDFYLDDVGFTDIKKYRDIKLHCAGSIGTRYVPQNSSIIQMVKADYTLVTPFMYSHWQDNANGNAVSLSEVNYQMYTTAGRPMGSSLAPNSDRISISSSFKPVAGLSIDVGGTFIRHGNVTESLFKDEQIALLASKEGQYSTDGSITQHPVYGKYGDESNDGYLPSANHRTMILTQPTKEYTFQADVNLGYEFPKTKIGKFAVNLGYTFEYIHNYGVGKDMFPGQGWYYDEATGKYLTKEEGGTEVDVDAELNAAYASWKAALKNVMNHYLTINFKYTF